MNDKRFHWDVSPVANSENCIVGDKYRFTVLESRLIRMEYSKDGVFEDRASQSVFYRDFPKCNFKTNYDGEILTIETEDIILNYNANAEFSNTSLSIYLKKPPTSCWNFGDEYESLDGTYRTLDQKNGEFPLGKSVCSRNGFSVIDDSQSFVLGEDGWVQARNESTLDYYFFGFGYDYLEAVKALYRLTGAPPLLPNYALGNWWSRCHKYTQKEYIELIEEFKSQHLPISVAVVDFDWHIREIPEDNRDKDAKYTGWTGYSWNKELFPDYKEFLNFLHKNNLKTVLNLHPADGVCPHEDMYPEMAKAMGIDPKSKKRVPFNVLSKEFMENYFDILHHPYEKDGVDFWWMDWQQGGDCYWLREREPDNKLIGLDPLWLLNHLHILDIASNGKRPMLLSRYSGIGSHRYPIGFSGDTYITWKNLDFQPYFTASASNVGYSWWSHDIGGFMRGYFNSELYTRWVQFGVFSPIFRIHASSVGGEYIRKEPWLHSEPYCSVLKKFMRLRHELFPYIYTMNRRNHKDLIPIIQPLYYFYPKKSAAYEFKNQYFFGSELMVCPITKPINTMTNMASAEVWLPKGEWFDFFNGLHYSAENDTKFSVFRTVEEYPVFAKSGAIVPMFEYDGENNKIDLSENVKVIVFPGASNTFKLYEDSGEGFEYKDGHFAETEFSLKWGKYAEFKIRPPQDKNNIIPANRKWTLCFRGFNRDTETKLFINNKEISINSYYNVNNQTVEVTFNANKNDEISIVLEGENLITDNETVNSRLNEILRRANVSVYRKNEYRDIMLNTSLGDYEKRLKMGGAASVDDQELYDSICEMLSLRKYINQSDSLTGGIA